MLKVKPALQKQNGEVGMKMHLIATTQQIKRWFKTELIIIMQIMVINQRFTRILKWIICGVLWFFAITGIITILGIIF